MFDTPLPTLTVTLDRPHTPLPGLDVATTPAQALDLAKIDLAAVVRAQFGPWRETTARLKAENAKTVLELSTQSKVDEAKSLRERTINKPVAEARAKCKALKSALAGASKTAGAEEEALVLAYQDAATPITTQIDAAQARIDAAKAEAARVEAERVEHHRSQIDLIRSYLKHAQEPDMTAERIAAGIAGLESHTFPSSVWEEFAVPAANAACETLEAMRTLHAQALGREQEAARQEAIRVENARVAAELAAERARIESEAAEIRRQAAELAAQRAESERLERLAEENRARLLAAELEAKNRAAADREAAHAIAQAAYYTPTTIIGYSPEAQKAAAGLLQVIAQAADADPAATPPGLAELRADSTPEIDAGVTAMLAAMPGGDPAPRVLLLAEPAPEDAALADLQSLAAEARASRFPAQPKMGAEWWARFYSVADALLKARNA